LGAQFFDQVSVCWNGTLRPSFQRSAAQANSSIDACFNNSAGTYTASFESIKRKPVMMQPSVSCQ